ncbi:MAG: hypothetical protein H7Z75_01010 [Ferruginibacter sp.]|nr:hypothetical protein [Cytophagales bacterium]
MQIKRFVGYLVLFTLASRSVRAQSVYAPLNPDYHHLVERYEIRYGRFAEGLHSHVKPYLRQAIVQLTDSVAARIRLSRSDRFNLTYLRNDSWEWADSADNESRKPVFKRFYRKKSDLFHYQQADFDLHVNPVLYLSGGTESNSSVRTYINTRGVELRTTIGGKLGLYTFIGENQAVFPGYVRARTDSFNVVPNEGFWKRYGRSGNGVDFLTARGYLAFTPVKYIHVQFGHDKNFIGNGYRSMILSDYSNNYLFLKLQTRVWRFQYTNLFTQMNGENTPAANQRIPQKYLAFHHLSVNLTDYLNVGLFEAVIYGADEGGYDLNFLNPIIFYRSIEQQSGSSNNALLGADFKLNFLRHFSLYGQLMLDEFLVKEVRAGNGWWANKQAGQIGLKYVDVAGIANLDAQLEYNVARPYTYSHFSEYTNYAHYGQPLAHPLGANFREVVGLLRYQPTGRLQLTGTAVYARYGTDPAGQNWGGNVLTPYTTRQQEYGNRIGQGTANTLVFLDFTASFQLKHNLFLDAKQVLRRLDSAENTQDQNRALTSVALRLNIPQRQQAF